ncbi:MAG: DUF3667 domain-containing protein [bacterium]|nr:DUF3667 domain-containing protein [bacterium]
MARPVARSSPSECPNCGAPLTGRYCAQCSQDNRAADLRFVDLGGDLIGALVSFDSRLWRTLRELTIDPGGVVRRYREGQRARYVSPLRYSLGTAALWWLVVSFAIPGNVEELLADHPYELAGLLYGQLINLLTAPVLGLPIALCFLGSGRSLLHQVVLSLYVCGHVFLWRAGLAGCGLFLPDAAAVPIGYVDFALFTLYLAVALWFAHRGLVRLLWLRVLAALVALFFVSSFVTGFLVGVITAWTAR